MSMSSRVTADGARGSLWVLSQAQDRPLLEARCCYSKAQAARGTI